MRRLGGSIYQGSWIKTSGGPLTLPQALGFIQSRGVIVPEYLRWHTAEHEGLTLREAGLENADAIYFRLDLNSRTADLPIQWEQFEVAGQVPIMLRAEVLESEEHALYVIAHEVHEIVHLREVFRQSGGWLTGRRLGRLITPELDGPVHRDAVRYADDLVRALRRERGHEP